MNSLIRRVIVGAAVGVLFVPQAFANKNKPGTESTKSGATSATAPIDTSGSTVSDPAMSDLELGTRYQIVDFRTGSSDLSQSDRESLRTLIENAKAKGLIGKLQVAVWSDKEFPKQEKARLGKADRDLAKSRVDRVKTYLHETLSMNNVETHNMAERAGWIARNFNTNDAELKSLFSQRGAAAPVTSEEFALIKQMGGPGKAVIVVQMKSAMDSSQKRGAGRMDTDTRSGTSTGRDWNATPDSTSGTTTDDSMMDDSMMDSDTDKTSSPKSDTGY